MTIQYKVLRFKKYFIITNFLYQCILLKYWLHSIANLGSSCAEDHIIQMCNFLNREQKFSITRRHKSSVLTPPQFIASSYFQCLHHQHNRHLRLKRVQILISGCTIDVSPLWKQFPMIITPMSYIDRLAVATSMLELSVHAVFIKIFQFGSKSHPALPCNGRNYYKCTNIPILPPSHTFGYFLASCRLQSDDAQKVSYWIGSLYFWIQDLIKCADEAWLILWK